MRLPALEEFVREYMTYNENEVRRTAKEIYDEIIELIDDNPEELDNIMKIDSDQEIDDDESIINIVNHYSQWPKYISDQEMTPELMATIRAYGVHIEMCKAF